MTITLEHISESVISLIESEAARHGRRVDEQIEYVLEEYAARVSRHAAAERLQQLHKTLLEQRGGIPFPDSLAMIRDMRDEE